MRRRVPHFFLLILTVLTLMHCSSGHEDALPFFNTADFTPQWINPHDAGYDSIHRIPSFSFVDQDGKTITEQSVAGKIVVADFFFTICPGICPRLTKSMGDVQAAFTNDSLVVLLSHSVTPDIDSIPRLKAYAVSHNVNSNQWHLLTGDRKEIYNIARQGYFADEETGLKKSENEFLHTENFILVDPWRRIRGVYNGTNPAEVQRLIEDIRILHHEL
jgi:protein SCO1